MFFRRGTSNKSSSSRGRNKIRHTSKQDVAEIKFLIDFASRNYCD